MLIRFTSNGSVTSTGWSASYIITQNNPPNKPILLTPENGSSVTIPFTLSWECDDPDGDSLEYTLFARVKGTEGWDWLSGLTNKYLDFTENLDYLTFEWYIVASDGEFESISDIWEFTIIGAPTLEYHSHEIDDDNSTSSGDNDGLAEPGESIEMPVTLINSGTGDANNVSAILSTTDPDITITDNDLSWGTIIAGSTERVADFDFDVSANCPEKDVTFTLDITADEGAWTDQFIVHIYVTISPVVEYYSHEIDDDNNTSSGDNDGLAEPGESIEMPVTLLNSGTGDANNVLAILSTTDPDITITDNDLSWGTIVAGSTGRVADFDFDVSANCPEKDVTFILDITSDEDSWTDQFIVHVYAATSPVVLDPKLSYEANFNSTNTDFLGNQFSIYTPSRFTNGCLNSPHPYEEAGNGHVIDYITQLKYPIIIDGNNSIMEFEEIVLVEPGEPGTIFGDQQFWDYVIVEGSKNNGESWVPLISGYDSRDDEAWLQSYNEGLDGLISNAVGDPTLFKKRTIDLLSEEEFVDGDTILIRFRLFSDPFAIGWGWVIDDLSIQGKVTNVENYPETKEEFIFYPNPAQDQLTIELDNFLGKHVYLNILDMNGQLLYSRKFIIHGQQIQEYIDLSSFANGIYLIELVGENGIIIKKLIIQ